MYSQVTGDHAEQDDSSTPLIGAAPSASQTPAPRAPVAAPVAKTALASEREPIHCTLAENISAKLSREGTVESFEVKGDLQLRVTDASVAQIKLALTTDDSMGVQYSTHPRVDKALFNSTKVVQLKDTSKGFPPNQAIGVMRWRYAAKSGEVQLPLTVTAWVNQGSDDAYSVTVEYELTGDDALRDVVITIPYSTSEPSVSSFDAVYEISGDSLDWNIGAIEPDSPTGSFEFEAQADSDAAFFPMQVRFSKTRPFVDVDVSFECLSYCSESRLIPVRSRP